MSKKLHDWPTNGVHANLVAATLGNFAFTFRRSRIHNPASVRRNFRLGFTSPKEEANWGKVAKSCGLGWYVPLGAVSGIGHIHVLRIRAPYASRNPDYSLPVTWVPDPTGTVTAYRAYLTCRPSNPIPGAMRGFGI